MELTYPLIYRSLYRLCGDGDTASDLTQDTYARAWRALDQFDGRSRFSTWLYRIAYTTFLNHVRRPQRFVQLDDATVLGRRRSLRPSRDPVVAPRRAAPPARGAGAARGAALRRDRALLGRGAGARDRTAGRSFDRRHPQAPAPRGLAAPRRARGGRVVTRISRRGIERGLRLPAPAPGAELGRRIKDQIPDDLFAAPDETSRRDRISGRSGATGPGPTRGLSGPVVWAVAASVVVALGAGWLAVRLTPIDTETESLVAASSPRARPERRAALEEESAPLQEPAPPAQQPAVEAPPRHLPTRHWRARPWAQQRRRRPRPTAAAATRPSIASAWLSRQPRYPPTGRWRMRRTRSTTAWLRPSVPGEASERLRSARKRGGRAARSGRGSRRPTIDLVGDRDRWDGRASGRPPGAAGERDGTRRPRRGQRGTSGGRNRAGARPHARAAGIGCWRVTRVTSAPTRRCQPARRRELRQRGA